MAFNNSVHAGFFLLILITGIFTTVTDLCHKKIRNNHLVIIAVAALILAIIKGFLDKSLPMLQLSSTGCAVIIAGVFYKNDLWRGGDAKLFILYSFLMPATGYESKIFLPSIALFVNSFIIALIFLGLVWVKDFFINHKFVTEDVVKSWTLGSIVRGTLVTLCLSWMIFPLLHACGLTKYGALSFLSIYLINVSLGSKIIGLIKNKAIAVIIFACGLFLHYKFSPGFFLWKNFLLYLSTVIFYSVFSIILLHGTRYIDKSYERIPFAPFLFLGCLASYTPFLGLIMFLQKSIRI